MNVDEAHAFAKQWADGWNAHDLEAVLSHFTDDATFASPVAAQMLPETEGVLRGKAAIRAYWQVGLERIPDLHFTVENVYSGLGTIVINYRNLVGALVCEVLHINAGGLAHTGMGTYLAADAAGASGARSA